MYLKRLELQGFKSFPEKTRLTFNTGITAVVGPNGSGKSNLSDAVRWVLGEQSVKSLRGAKMEDVIFAGTQNRKPLGFAEVSMVVDNTDRKLPVDFNEITVTRRVYRSGESEYQLNGVHCRLKDIYEIFMDTGIGREGYSIIGQGRVDEILNAKSEDRRLLFEEAAGIMKYKTRKIEAESKLNKEKQNLLRVEDIIRELTAQVEPLRIQSDKAKEYLVLADRLKLVKINLFLWEVNQYQEKKKTLEENEVIVSSRIAEIKEEKASIQQQWNDLENKKNETEKSIQDINEQIVTTRIEMEQKENDIRITEERILHMSKDRNRLQQSLTQKEEWLKTANEEKSRLSNILAALEKEREEKQGEMDAHQSEFNALNEKLSGSEEQLEKYNQEIIACMNALNETQNRIQNAKLQYEQLEQRKERLDEKMADNKDYLAKGEKALNLLCQQLDDITGKQEKILEENIHYENELSTLKINEAEQNTAYESIRKKLHETLSRHRLLQELEESYEGYYKSVKAILKKKRSTSGFFTGIHGAVGELVTVPKHLELAIEIALGNAMQHLIVQKEEDAKDAIAYLKEKREGRATFLPITAIQPKNLGSMSRSVCQENGILGIASELVQYQQEYKNIFGNLLGKVVIADNLENALPIFKKYHHAFKIVTLEGDVLNPGGSLTGGSVTQRTVNLFSRNREIKEIKHLLAELENSKEHFEKMLADTRSQLNICNDKLQLNYELKQKLEIDKAKYTQEREQAQTAFADSQARRKQYMQENTQLMDQLVQLNQTVRNLEAVSRELADKQKTLKEKADTYQYGLVQDREYKDTKMKDLMDLRAGLSGIEQQIKSIHDQTERMIKDIGEGENEIEVWNEELRKLKENLEQSGQEINNAKKAIESLQIQKEEYNIQLTRLKEESKIISLQMEEKEDQKVNYGLEEGKLENERTRLELKREQMDMDIRRLYDEMWEEYEITLHSAKTYETLETSFIDLQKEEKKLKLDIRNMGNVYVGAIEEYKEKKDRLTFLTTQKEDILLAEERLAGLIDELTALMEKQFISQVKQISEHFNHVFREMFGGGRASLRMSKEDQVLESGIDILVQPPGKNLQVMTLLSGGERALTATALLFAILRMKPSPFCILDEIEAALDDANVRRFANFVKNFAQETQFIIITHKKGTMVSADTLYGVTMQEQGVSKLVSVQFTEETAV